MPQKRYRRKQYESESESSESEDIESTEEEWETDDSEEYSDESSEEESDEEESEEESEEFSEEESDDTSDSSYVPSKKGKDEKISRKDIQKIVAKMFPSKYMDEKVRRSERLERKRNKIKRKSPRRTRESLKNPIVMKNMKNTCETLKKKIIKLILFSDLVVLKMTKKSSKKMKMKNVTVMTSKLS